MTVTNAYPVGLTCDRNGCLHHYGFASTAEEARQIYTHGLDRDEADDVGLPTLQDVECYHVTDGHRVMLADDERFDSETEARWADEERTFLSIGNAGQWRKVWARTWMV
jgi:hypothetical protein